MTAQPSKLAGKTALITGAAKRIGHATALALAQQGANVIIHYRSSAEDAEALARTIRNLGPHAWTLQADLADPKQARELISHAQSQAGALDFLINNAAIFPTGKMSDADVEDFAESIQVNALAPFLVARAFAQQNRPGAVVNFLDARMVDHDPRHVPYNVSKRMLFVLTRMMALEFAPAVRVNAVAPGIILPPPGKDESYLEGLAETNPLRRVGTVEEIAHAVLFLLQNEFITGQVIFVDGGRHLRGSVYGC